MKTIIGNWKMNKTIPETEEFLGEFTKLLSGRENCNTVICVPFTLIAVCRRFGVAVGAQNLYPEKSGAYTGEISAGMLSDAGVKFALCGHSERRAMGESDGFINKKVKAADDEGLSAVLCIGETLTDREAGRTEAVLAGQLESGLASVENKSGIYIAYEPVWAIGTGKTAESTQIEQTHTFIKKQLKRITGTNIPVLYGGSVNEGNSGEIMALKNVDGVLVGGASLDPKKFASIIHSVE